MSLNRVIKRLKIEMSGSTKQYQVSAKQHDRATRYVEVELLDNERGGVDIDIYIALSGKQVKPKG